MKRIAILCVLVLAAATTAAPPKPLVDGLKRPTAVAIGADGKTYVATAGELRKDGDGEIVVVQDGKAVGFAKGFNDPTALVVFQGVFFVADKDRVWKVGKDGKPQVLVAAKAFSKPPEELLAMTVDPESGFLYVAEERDKVMILHRVTQQGKVTRAATVKVKAAVSRGLTMDGASHLIVSDWGGEISRIRLSDGAKEQITEAAPGCQGMTWDNHGQLFLSLTAAKLGAAVIAIPRPGAEAALVTKDLGTAFGLCLSPDGKSILFADMEKGTLEAIPTQVPGHEVDDSPLKDVELVPAFPDVKWTGWEPVNDAGKQTPLRPILLTHAGDGSNRIFVPTQQGVVHILPDGAKTRDTKVFLDIRSKVFYSDDENEQGFLGMTFHPDYKKNGEFFVFYTDRKKKTENVITRFKVSKDDPNKADPRSEEEVFRISRPFWNHDGGTICFGPDGFLYVALGDGGSANDPFGHAQNMKSLLGKVLRLDVNAKDEGKKYAVPGDNPFVGKRDVRPEIWASGLRNIWRMHFDRKTGKLWAGEVGQNLWEEINIIEKGGNYGWNLRESLHPFGPKGVGVRKGVGELDGVRKDLIDPIWEYHHDIGKSITGGPVYRGKDVPALEGHYLYADYVSNKVWALKYDEGKKRVVANRTIKDVGLPIMSFGEDERGEVYLMTFTASGQGIWRFAAKK